LISRRIYELQKMIIIEIIFHDKNYELFGKILIPRIFFYTILPQVWINIQADFCQNKIMGYQSFNSKQNPYS